MKRFSFFLVFVIAVQALWAQSLVTDMADMVGLSANPYYTALLEAEENTFWRISSTYSDNVVHPVFEKDPIINDFRSIYFIKYDSEGEVLGGNYLYGSSNPIYAEVVDGNLMIIGSSFENEVIAGGVVPNLPNPFPQSRMEFLATFDAAGNPLEAKNLWGDKEYAPYSEALIDPFDGSVYLYGTSYQVLYTKNGEELGVPDEVVMSFFYLVKFDKNGEELASHFFDFDRSEANGYYQDYKVFPDGRGGVVVSTNYSNNAKPLIEGTPYAMYSSELGTLAVFYNENLEVTDVLNGKGGDSYSYGVRIFDVFPMPDGDFIFCGNTTSGHYSLGGAVVDFPTDYSANQFAFKISPKGEIGWQPIPINSEGPGEGKKKSTKGEDFESYLNYDALFWKGKRLYMTGRFGAEPGVVAGHNFDAAFNDGVYLLAIDPGTGDISWMKCMSSDYVEFKGMDIDQTGSVTIIGEMSNNQEFADMGVTDEKTSNFMFLVGFDSREGTVVWYNNARIMNGTNYWTLNADDLVVLPEGQVFTSFNLSEANEIELGGNTMDATKNAYSTWVANLTPSMQLGGTVRDIYGNKIHPAKVRAIRIAPWGRYPTVNVAETGTDGTYRFQDLYPGNYILHALPDADAYPDLMPTYLGGYYSWLQETPSMIQVNLDLNFVHIIVLPKPYLDPTLGKGEIGGNISFKDGIEDATKGTMGHPVKKVPVILIAKNKKKAVEDGLPMTAYAETDEDGNFYIRNVPDGQYTMWVEIPGLDMIGTYDVTIEGEMIITQLDFEVSDFGIDLPEGTPVLQLEETQLKLYPNPGNGQVYLELPEAGSYRAQLYQSNGKLVLDREFDSQGGATSLDLGSLNEGLYLIRVSGEGLRGTVRYICK